MPSQHVFSRLTRNEPLPYTPFQQIIESEITIGLDVQTEVFPVFTQTMGKVVFVLLILGAVPPVSMAETRLKMAFPEFFPFFAESKEGKVEGFFYDLITEALDHRMGIPVTWVQMPWKRCQNLVRFGEYDAMITVPTQERRVYCETHPTPFYRKELKLFTYRGHDRLSEIQHIRSIEDIKKGGFSVITYSGNSWNKSNIEIIGIPTRETSEVHNVWKMLAAKRGDLVIEWPVGARTGMDRSGVTDRIVETEVSLESMPFHLLISKKSRFTTLLIRFNRVVEDMLEDGSIKEITAKYVADREQTGVDE